MEIQEIEYVDTCERTLGRFYNDTKPREIIIRSNEECVKVVIAHDYDGTAYLVYGTP